MKRKRKQENNKTMYFAAINPLTDIVHVSSVGKKGVAVETGQPILFTSENKEDVYDMVDSDWEYTPYTEAEAADLESVLDDINESGNLIMTAIDRPGSTDKLLIFSDIAFNSLPSATKAKLLPKKETKDGKRLKKAQL